MKKNILLVEDEAVIAMVTIRELEREGYRVFPAYNGKVAVERARSNQPAIDLVLMDVDLGNGPDGTEVAQEILKHKVVPILFLSSHTEKEIVDKTEKITSYGYVVKNSGITVLAASIKMAFKLHEAYNRLTEKSVEIWAANSLLQNTIQELEETNQKLTHSEKEREEQEIQYRFLANNMSDSIWLLDMNLKFVYTSPSVFKNTGFTLEELNNIPREDLVVTESHIPLRNLLSRMLSPSNLENPDPFNRHSLEIQLYRKDRSTFWNDTIFTVINNENGVPVHILICGRDITCRKHVEAERNRLNRALKALSNCNQTLLRASDEPKLLEEITSIIHHQAGYPFAWVGYTDDKNCTVQSVALAGGQDCLLVDQLISYAPASQYHIPIGVAIHENQTQCIQDFLVDPLSSPIGQAALDCGFRSCIILPLQNFQSQVFGILMIYSNEPNVFITDELWLLEELADDLAFGISILRSQEEKRRMEHALTTREHQYRTLIEHLPELIVRYDTELRRIFVNPAWEKASGISEEQALGTKPQDILPEYNTVNTANTEYTEKLQKVLDTGIPESLDFSWVNAYGKTLHLEYLIVPEYNRDSQIIGVLAAGRDVTERKLAIKALHQSEKKYRTLFEESLDGLFLTSPNGKILDANKKCLDIFGYDSKDELDTIDLEKDVYVYASDRASILESACKEGYTEFEVELKRKGGERIYTFGSFARVDNEAGEVEHFRGILRDISVNKMIEHELFAHLRFLENIERVNHAMHGTNDLEHMMSNLLDLMLTMFDSDRASLVYPCDPQAATWTVPMERTKPEFPGVLEMKIEVPVDEVAIMVFNAVLETDHPVRFGEGMEKPLPAVLTQKFQQQCQLGLAIYPKIGKPWLLVLHQCAYLRIWNNEEVKLFAAIGSRLSDALTSVLMYRELKSGEATLLTTLDQLKATIQDKDVLLRELQHRVINSLNLILNLIILERSRVSGTHVQNVLDNLNRRVLSLVKLYEFLYQTGSITQVRLDTYLDAVLKSIGSAYVYDPLLINIQKSLDPISVDAKSAMAWGLIMNELLTNALKYAFAKGQSGTIQIILQKNEDTIQLKVIDDGSGPPARFSLEKSTGFGLNLVYMLSLQLGGTVNFTRTDETCFEVIAPKVLLEY